MELIGRTREVAEVGERLRHRRLVTLIGPAGIGKTALAASVMRSIGGDFELGAHLVDLTRVDSAQDVAGAIAGQLGIASFDALINSPTEKPALVVVDNCEHVTAAAADAINALLASCESPRVLATSRSPLDLPGESLVVLGPLGLPAPGTTDTDNDAVRLFLDRARDAGGSIGADQLDVVAGLCRYLDGVPLALELAAAQTRVIQPGEILDRLRAGVDILVRPRFRGHDRHRSLSATVEWSYRLLPADAAAVFERLGVCAGPFTAELGKAIALDAGLDPVAAERTLGLLVDSSLVVVERTGDTTRYRLLESLRMFARNRLTDQGRYDEVCGRLVDHIVAMAADELGQVRRWDGASFGRLLSLYDNAVAALRWCLDHDDDGTRAFTLCAVLWGVVHQGHTDEIAAMCTETLNRWPEPAGPHAAGAHATAATARFLTGDPHGALALARRGLVIEPSSPTADVLLRRAMAYAARAIGEPWEAVRSFADVADRARRSELPALALEADVNRAQLLADAGDMSTARSIADAARAQAAEEHLPINEVWARSILAQFTLRADITAGLDAVSDALDAARRIPDPAAIAINLRALAWGLIRSGRHRAAAESLIELFDHLLARGGVAELRGALLTTAELFHAVGLPSWTVLAATALSLQPSGPTGSSMDALTRLPTSDDGPLNRREGVALARRQLRSYLTGNPSPAPQPVEPLPVEPLPVEPQPAGLNPTGSARLTNHGQYWEVVYGGRSAHLKATKGMADLGRLLFAQGRELHCMELMGGAVDESSTGDVLDRQARLGYEQRIRDLQADIDAAEDDNDHARADHARLEMDALVDHLTAALGLSRRTRRAAGSAERARSAVTQRIRSTIRGLTEIHPELARHLQVSVTTGTYCSYRPEHPVTWQR